MFFAQKRVCLKRLLGTPSPFTRIMQGAYSSVILIERIKSPRRISSMTSRPSTT